MKSKLTTELLTPDTIFADCLFRVPDYQRGYSWENHQRNELLEDLEYLPESKHHYTGTLVLHNVEDKRIENECGQLFEQYDIVDGQQRLTTIVLLLDAIRRELKKLDDTKLADGLTDRYIFITDRNDQSLSKLTLNGDCHQFFEDCLRGVNIIGPAVRAQQNISDAKQQFADYFEEKQLELKEDYSNWLDCFRAKICQRLAFTVYTVDDASDVGVIFEVMNDRGLQITNLEKVKNYLLYLTTKLKLSEEHNLAEQINDTWSHVFQTLMSCGLSSTYDEDRLLRMHWIMAYDYNLKNWKGSKSIKAKFHLRNYIDQHEQLLDELKQYIRTLKDSVKLYCDIFCPEQNDAFNSYHFDQTKSDIVRFSQKLCRLNVMAPFIPLLMAIRFRKPSDAGAYLRTLKLCENYSFRIYRFLKRRANAGRSTLYQIANEFYNNKKTFENSLDRVASLINYYSPQKRFANEAQLNDTENDWYHWGGIKYFLYEYEEHLAQGRGVRIPWSQLESDKRMETIEHVLPQTPTEGYWTERFTPQLRKKFTHDFSNLCLTSDNSSYSNKPFPKKKGEAGSSSPCYAIGQSNMERKLCEYDDWTEKELIDRRNKIVKWLLERWLAPESATSPEEIQDEIVDDDESDGQ